MRLRGFVPVCGLTVMLAVVGSWRMVPDLALRLPSVSSVPSVPSPTPDLAPVVVQAYMPFVYHDPSALGETLVCVSNKEASPIPPLFMPPLPVSTP